MAQRLPVKVAYKSGFGQRRATRWTSSPTATRSVIYASPTGPASFMRAAGFAASAPSYALRQAAAVGSSQEVKTFDCPITAPAVSLPSAAAAAGGEPAAAFLGITEINCVQQLGTFYGRIGAKIVIRSVEFTCNLSGIGDVTDGACRLLLVYDRQTNGAFPAIADVLSTANAAGVTIFSAGINMTNKSRFSIIRDFRCTFDAVSKQTEIVHLYAKGRWESEFGSTDGDIGDIRTGAIYLIAFSGTMVGAGVNLLDGMARVRYYD